MPVEIALNTLKAKYPKLFLRFGSKHANLATILTVIEKSCQHFFNLQELDATLSEKGEWPVFANSYLNFFEACVESGSSTTEFELEEISPKIFKHLYKITNDPNFSSKDFTTPAGCTNVGFWEKYQQHQLGSDISKAEVLKGFAFTTLDMLRTGSRISRLHEITEKYQVNINFQVLELSHLPHIKDEVDQADVFFLNKPLFIRTHDEKKGLSQWILYYIKDGKRYLYSESPLNKEDKTTLFNFLPNPHDIIQEFGDVALSMSSGMRAYARYNDQFEGCGVSCSADYFANLPEWVWFTRSQEWGNFLQHTLVFNPAQNKFSVYDLYKSFLTKAEAAEAEYNRHIQLRSFPLGMDKALADPKLKWLQTVNGTVTFNLPDPFTMADVGDLEKYAAPHLWKARIPFPYTELFRQSPTDPENIDNIPTGLTLNVFRACAKERNLIINLNPKYLISQREQDLVVFLMNSNPFVCKLENPKHNPSLESINTNLKHIFARNRWLRANEISPAVTR